MVDVTKCHACHIGSRGVTGDKTGLKGATQCHKCHACHAKRRWMWVCATPATWNENGCHQVPRLPRKVPRRHRRQIRAQARHPMPWVPRLPRKTTVDVSLCQSCHVRRRWMSPSATPCRGVTGDKCAPPSTISATPATQNDRGCQIVPRLPRETKVDVTKCHACHAKCRGVTGDKSGPKGATQCHKCHACHAKRPGMWVCATAATWNEGGCHQVPRLPRKVPRRHGRQIRAQARHPMPWVPRLPRKTTVDVRLCHACHVKRRWMSPSATPATQSAPAPPNAISATPCEVIVCERWYVTKLCVRSVCEVMVCSVCVCEVIVCERWYVTKLCVWVCMKLLYVKFVCVKLWYVRDGMWQSCVFVWVCVWSYCMLNLCVCVCEAMVCECEVIVCERLVCEKVVCEAIVC